MELFLCICGQLVRMLEMLHFEAFMAGILDSVVI